MLRQSWLSGIDKPEKYATHKLRLPCVANSEATEAEKAQYLESFE